MSLTKSTTARRRLSLMAGSSLVAASLSALVSAGVALTPTAAFAYDECLPTPATGTLTDGEDGVSDPTLNVALPDTFTCAAALYADGITYTSAGDPLTVTVTSNGVDVGATGIRLIGTGGDDVTLSSTVEIDGNGLTGPLVDVSSATGTITLNLANIDADQTNATAMTHGIRALSGGGDIFVTAATVDGEISSATGGQAGVEARVTTGNGSVSVTTTGSVNGRLRGIHAQSIGTGTLTVNASSSVSTSSAGLAAIDAISGSGLMTLNIGSSVSGSTGNAVRTMAGGNLVVNLTNNAFVSAVAREGDTPANWVMDLTAGGSIALTNDGNIRSTGSNEVAWSDLAIKAVGGSLLLDNRNSIQGRVDFSGVTGGVEFNHGGTALTGRGWRTTGASVFSPGADELNVDSGYSIQVSALATTGVDIPTAWDFGAGADTINLAAGATLTIGPRASGNITSRGELEITNLESFNNAGTILLGLFSSAEADGDPDDRLAMAGATFTGSGASRIAMDVDFQGTGQATCEAALVTDCVYLAGGATAGSTVLSVHDASTETSFAGYLGEGIVLIDVSGGTSAAAHFTLDPNSSHYIDEGPNVGLMEKGYFIFALVFDPENVQHKLISVPNNQLMAFTALPQAMQSVWHTSTGFGFDRHAELRGGEDGPGVWLRAGGESSERDLAQTFSQFSTAVSYDTDYTQQTNSLTGGVDLVGEAWGGEYVVGAMLGYVRSDLKFDDALTNATWEGATLGLYGGYGSGPLRLDAVVNGLAMAADLEDPAVELPTGLINREVVRAVGARGEASYRLGLGGIFVEPLVAASWVRGRFDQLMLQQAKIDYDEPTSARLGAGLRVGADVPMQDIVVRLGLTGRIWNEFDGDNTAIVDNDGEDLPLIDDFSGTFSELGASASMVLDGGLGVFANAGGKFNDGYRAVNGALGFTYRW